MIEQPSATDSKQSWRKWCKAHESAGDAMPDGAGRGETAGETRAEMQAALLDELEKFLTPLPSWVLIYFSAKPPPHWEPVVEALVQRFDAVPGRPDAVPERSTAASGRSGSAPGVAHDSAMRSSPMRGNFAVTRTPKKGPLTIHPVPHQSAPNQPTFDQTTSGQPVPHQTASPSPVGLEQHPYGFMQPVAGTPELSPDCIAIALVPGLLFDKHGNRLGHGAGYYDELLARLPADSPRVGVCWSSNIVDLLPTQDHDVPMTHLATEHGVKAVAPPR